MFKLVTLNRIFRITGVTSGCWWLVGVNAIPISDICQINQQNISSYTIVLLKHPSPGTEASLQTVVKVSLGWY
jgi:hypothetical protein